MMAYARYQSDYDRTSRALALTACTDEEAAKTFVSFYQLKADELIRLGILKTQDLRQFLHQ